MLFGHPLIARWTPPQIGFGACLNKLEYHVRLTYLHLHRENQSTRLSKLTPHLPQLCIQEPAIVERCHGWPIGSTTGSIIANRVDKFTCREPLAFERNTGYSPTGRMRRRGAGVGAMAAYRY